jgi:micrococcal nuclease
MDHAWTYPAVVVRVVDGDTVRLNLDLGLHIWRTDNCRIAGINAPETSTPAGTAAAAYAAKLLPAGAAVTFASERLEKYGRPLGRLVLADGRDFATVMLAAGHAVPYMA